jgi:pimeloyl-ACP methyl ester carboxylesterase
MNSVVTTLFHLTTAIMVASCALQKPQSWNPDERSGLVGLDSRRDIVADIVPIDKEKKQLTVKIKGKMIERMISIPINRNDPATQYFDLYYFVRMPTNRATKTVLYIPGGPGQFMPGPIVMLTIADFLTDNGYNVVFYHPRGAGFSQIPASNRYDKFLKTSYVLDDIEAIRQDLIQQNFLGASGNWAAIIGYSFGTVVAQQYAGTYGNLERLILIGVESRHSFESSHDVFDQMANKIREINRSTLETIYKRKQFDQLTSKQKSDIIDKAFGTKDEKGIYQIVEEKFGTVGFVISEYCALKDELAKYQLDKYSLQFFRALRSLRDVGWFPAWQRQEHWATQIKDGVLGSTSVDADCGSDLTESSDRVLNVVSIYDGINMRFLKKWLDNGRANLRDAVRASGGETHYERGINKYLNKVGIDESETIVPWDPARARYKHDKPTLILNGSADTIPVGEAADHFFLNALDGPRILINYPGVGHVYFLPRIPSKPELAPSESLTECNCIPPEKPAVCMPGAWILDCLIYSFLEMSPETFSSPNDNNVLPVIMQHDASICYRDQNTSQTRKVGNKCP